MPMKRSFLRRSLALLLALASAAALTGCVRISLGSRFVSLSDAYTTITETPERDTVYRIEIDNMSFINSRNVSVRIAYSDDPSVEAVISEELLDYGFAVTAKNGVLRIGPSRHLELSTDRFELTICARFDEIALSGGYEVEIDASGAESLSLDVSGAASGSIGNLSVSDFSAKVAGAGAFSFFGTADEAAIHISGAGDIDAAGFACNTLDAKISGAGDMTVSVLDMLDAKISGVGSIEYYGSPTVAQSVSGVGTVSQKAEKLPGT